MPSPGHSPQRCSSTCQGRAEAAQPPPSPVPTGKQAPKAEGGRGFAVPPFPPGPLQL